MVRTLTRREALVAGTAGMGMLAAGFDGAPARANDYAEQIKAFTGGKEPVEARVKLELPELAENGNTVPLTVSVDVPTIPNTSQSYVEEILVVAPANPNARVARFQFSPDSVPQAATRIRLAETQNVIAVARMSDGRFFSAARPIKVTIGGCGG